MHLPSLFDRVELLPYNDFIVIDAVSLMAEWRIK